MSRTLAPGRYLGARQSSYSDSNCYVEEAAYRDGDRLPAHDHAAAHVCYVLAGRYSERFAPKGRRVALAANLEGESLVDEAARIAALMAARP